MPRRPAARAKVEQLSSGPPNPFKTILPDNNNKELRADTVVLNGLGSPEKIHHEVDPCHKYLHKKFKKVATLEQVSPPNGKRLGEEKRMEEEEKTTSHSAGRYVCPYCKLACPKPSVLQKHIRAHTNERPYPCRPCGFAFKTKSNLYKHCRSRAHTLKMDADSPSDEDEDKDKGTATEPKRIYKPKFHTLSEHDDSGESEPDKSEYPSKLALALLRPDETSQPLNLVTKKDTTHRIDGSIIKDILLKARSGLKGRMEDETELKQHTPSPSEAQKVRLFGGEVRVLDSDSQPAAAVSDTSPVFPPEIVMISKPGLHSLGRTTISAETPSPPPFGKVVVPMAPISVAGVSSVPFPPVNGITAFNPLTLPEGLVTVVHGGRPVPHVPGMPGPNSLEPLAPPPVPPSSKVSLLEGEEPPAKKARINEELPSRTNEPTRLLKIDLPDEMRSEKKFVRPTSLPLKTGGTYVSKKPALGPAAASLVSPETPRPRKSYGQLYLNGHAYTYLGLKCSTRMFFCTLNKPQPIYLPLLPQHAKLSMYSNWKVCSETVLSPVGISPGDAMSSYDSRNRNCHYTTASKGSPGDYMAHSSYASSQKEVKEPLQSPAQKKEFIPEETDKKRVKVCDGGYESNEDYIYVRGRGRGRYVCEECGIRCKKPSMLKKHIRTHTDVRPYTCEHCAFSFKTKGNLTKHMKSKSHFKRCVELDISPVPISVEESNINREMLAKQEALRAERGADITQSSEESDEEEETDDEEEDETDEDAGQSLQLEAAASLLSLSEVAIKSTLDGYARLGLLSTTVRPATYPYTTLTKLPESNVPPDSAVAASAVTPPLLPEGMSSPRLPPSHTNDGSSPIDLSNKPPGGSDNASAAMLVSILSTTERVSSSSSTPDPVEKSRLLDRYLQEKAAWQSQLRRNDKPPPPPPPPLPREKDSDSEMRQPARESALGILALTNNQAALARVSKLHQAQPHPPKGIHSTPLQPKPLQQTLHKPVTSPPKPKAEFMPPTSNNYLNLNEDGKSVCRICQKVFSRQSQLMLHVNIHYFERPFRCDACAVSFRTNGHLQKHQRSLSHLNKVNMNSTFGTATTTNPRPFKCDDCKIAFRIHGHLAKHLRSKMHIMRLECVGKLPFGLYAELERCGVSMNDIDTTDCENSLESLQVLAQKMHEKDPTKLGQWAPPETNHPNIGNQMNLVSCGETSSDEDEPRALIGEKQMEVPKELVQRLLPLSSAS